MVHPWNSSSDCLTCWGVRIFVCISFASGWTTLYASCCYSSFELFHVNYCVNIFDVMSNTFYFNSCLELGLPWLRNTPLKSWLKCPCQVFSLIGSASNVWVRTARMAILLFITSAIGKLRYLVKCPLMLEIDPFSPCLHLVYMMQSTRIATCRKRRIE